MLNAFIIAAFSFASVSFIFSFWTKNNCFFRFGALCILIFAVAVFSGNKQITFFLYAILSVYILKTELDNAIYFYLVLLPVFPLAVSWSIGLPGIDVLIILNHNRVLLLCLFGPLFLRLLGRGIPVIDPAKSYSGVADRLILFYIFIECFTHFRDDNSLVAARNSILVFIDIWLPYFVISRSIKNVDTALVVVVYTAAMLAVLSIIEEKVFYRIYDAITLPMGEPFKLMKLRGGKLRTFASMNNPLVLGFFFALSFLVAVKIRSLLRCPIYVPLFLGALIILGVEASGSRSPLAANFIGFLVLIWWFFGRQFVKKTATYAFIFFILFLVWFFSGGIDLVLQLDNEQGTFYYRYELILNSMHLIKENLLFGSSPAIFLQDPILMNSIQGEGIIDVTNTYLFLMLKSGIFSLLAFLGIWLTVLRGLYVVETPEHTASILMSVSISTMFMLFICSPILFVPAYFWILIALSIGLIRRYSGGVIATSQAKNLIQRSL
ncbi:hypothetical protein AB835_10415 [Candidatus Endobugula sertula]|uniref:O-antigen ligase-related domain-containing protein n=1 Tax=Candidatus Endobugula sertula TaxID=62101 RepID=A0A1D2QNH1_9GAMM|nr:hypothetical protein AB835_10415 [Candidatus Endobugula sertula]